MFQFVPSEVIFVCSGNTCRSPMAHQIALKKIPSLEIASAGLYAREGQPMSVNAGRALESRGWGVFEHRSVPFHSLTTCEESLVLTMTRHHLEQLRKMEGVMGESALLGHFLEDEKELSDPFGGTLEDYLSCCSQIEKSIELWAQHLPLTFPT